MFNESRGPVSRRVRFFSEQADALCLRYHATIEAYAGIMHPEPSIRAAGEAYAEAEKLLPVVTPLALRRNLTEVQADPLYRSLAPRIEGLLNHVHQSDFRPCDAPPRPRYRAVAWNVERGTRFAKQVDALQRDPRISGCDLLLVTEADAGMARSGNRMVAEELARALGMAQVFAPCYLALGKGSGAERDATGANRFGLHGNALLSRYPIRDARAIALPNGVDKMAHREKRLGRQAAVVATVDIPGRPLQAVSLHLDAQSTQRHRFRQMQVVLDQLDPSLPTVIGGDWNTSTYDSSHALWAILGFWRRVMMGVDHVIRNHYLYPDRWFERDLFRQLEKQGFDYRSANVPGAPTVYYDIGDIRARRNLNEWVPAWCFAFIQWSLRNHGGRCPLKLDWFAVRGLRAEDPTVAHDLARAYGEPLSDHDPIAIDFVL
ncbi:MAG TPA: endonuclease/exonuclease/phosphatase family protein [Terriglobia bacterium]|nr:endonuclease/exonuclease/phosphatase family protein [Terriglobia bacterium]